MLIGSGMLEFDDVLDLPVIGVLSIDELLPVRPLVTGVKGVDAFLGAEEPNPTGVGPAALAGVRPPPDRIDEDRRMPLPRGDESSELSDILDPAREGGLDPPLLPGSPEARLYPGS